MKRHTILWLGLMCLAAVSTASVLEASDLYDPADHSEAEVASAQQFSEGLTPTDLAVNVVSVGEHGLPPPPGFLMRARGFLIGWPERARDLVPLYEQASTDQMRALILDLLTSAGTPQAQGVIVELDDATRIAAVGGLGNAGMVDDLPRIRAFRNAEDASLRAQVASSLQSMPPMQVADDLFAPLADPERRVAAVALASLMNVPDEDARWVRLQDAVLIGQYNRALASELVTLLGPRGADDPSAAAALEALADRSADGRLRHRVRRAVGDDVRVHG